MSNKDDLPILGRDDSSEPEKEEQESQDSKLWEEKLEGLGEEEVPSIEERKGLREEEKVAEEIPSIEERGMSKDSISSGDQSKSGSSCKELEKKNTTFIFVYGASQAGKSCFMVSFLSHMSKDLNGRLKRIKPHEEKKNHSFLEKMIQDMEQGIFPQSTQNVYELSFSYTPKKPKIPAKFTFLEIPGESLEKVHLTESAPGVLEKHIDIYLKCPKINVCFIMIIPCDAGDKGEVHWATIDGNTLSFLDYIEGKDEKFDAANLLLLVSKWDEYNGEESPLKFVESKMPRTYAALNSRGSLIGAYSVGIVEEYKDKDGKIVERVDKLDKIRPEKVKKWLYEAVTGKPIANDSKSSWSTLSKWF